MLWFGLLFMLVVLFRPEGLAGLWQDFRAGKLRRRAVTRGGLLALLRR
jgi:branched-chain amino acid transport system permease protein